MNNIHSKHSKGIPAIHKSEPVKQDTAETAGILAFNTPSSLLSVGIYDSFISSNPFVMDFSNYTPYSDCEISATSDFMSGFASAVSVVGTSGTCDCASVSCDCSCSSSSSSGSFTSVC